MVAAVATNMAWNTKKDWYPATFVVKKKNFDPNKPETLVPYINAKPKAQNVATDIPKSVTFLSATLILLFALDKPDSRHIKPACIKKTKIAQIKSQNVSRLACKTASSLNSKALFAPLLVNSN